VTQIDYDVVDGASQAHDEFDLRMGCGGEVQSAQRSFPSICRNRTLREAGFESGRCEQGSVEYSRETPAIVEDWLPDEQVQPGWGSLL